MSGLSGTQKAAIVLMNMEREQAARVLQQFTDVEAEEIAGEIVRLSRVDDIVADRALSEFRELAMNGSPQQRGGRDAAVGLLEASFGADRAAGLISRVDSFLGGGSFGFLDELEPSRIAQLLAGELPQAAALVLVHLRPELASSVLGCLADDRRIDVAQSIATMGSATPEAIGIVASTLKLLSAASSPARPRAEVVGGVQPLVDIINRSDAATERALLQALDGRDPALADAVRAQLVGFEDLLRLAARDVQQVLRGFDTVQLALAIKGAAEPIVELVRANLSERNRDLLADEVGSLGAVRSVQVDDARAELVRVMRSMLADGIVAFEELEEHDLVA